MNAIVSALVTVFGIMFLGLLAERRRILAPTMALCLNQFVYWVSLPALIFMQMCTIPMGGAQAFAYNVDTTLWTVASYDDALNGTTAVHTIALMKGASILRVHDVKAAVEAVRIVGALPTSKPYGHD